MKRIKSVQTIDAQENTHRGLEYHEEVLIIVGVHRLAAVAKVFGAIRTAEPFTRDSVHTSIAHGGVVQKSGQVS